MDKFTISKKDILDILGDQEGADVSDDTVITAVTLTEDAVEFSLEEKKKEEVSGEE